jgi:hypothetical protein
MTPNKPLTECTDAELKEILREASRNVVLGVSTIYDEMNNREQVRYAAAMNRWTYWITIATIINAAAAVLTALKS